jgi:RNase P subunit RPR2
VADTAVIPDDRSRWRCAHCGNLTRFDVTRTSKVREFWHLTMGGEPQVDEREVLVETVETVACRWCGAADRIEVVARPEFGGPADEGPGDGGP